MHPTIEKLIVDLASQGIPPRITIPHIISALEEGMPVGSVPSAVKNALGLAKKAQGRSEREEEQESARREAMREEAALRRASKETEAEKHKKRLANPRRRRNNADDRLRKLEREAENDPAVAKQLAYEMVRLGRWHIVYGISTQRLVTNLGYRTITWQDKYGLELPRYGHYWTLYEQDITWRDPTKPRDKILRVTTLPSETRYYLKQELVNKEGKVIMSLWLNVEGQWTTEIQDWHLMTFDTKAAAREASKQKVAELRANVNKYAYKDKVDWKKSLSFVKRQPMSVHVWYEIPITT